MVRKISDLVIIQYLFFYIVLQILELYVLLPAISYHTRQTKSTISVASKILTCNLIKLKRNDLRKVMRILTRQCPLNLFTIGATHSPLCRGCIEAEETPQHILIKYSNLLDKCGRSTGRHPPINISPRNM